MSLKAKKITIFCLGLIPISFGLNRRLLNRRLGIQPWYVSSVLMIPQTFRGIKRILTQCMLRESCFCEYKTTYGNWTYYQPSPSSSSIIWMRDLVALRTSAWAIRNACSWMCQMFKRGQLAKAQLFPYSAVLPPYLCVWFAVLNLTQNAGNFIQNIRTVIRLARVNLNSIKLMNILVISYHII